MRLDEQEGWRRGEVGCSWSYGGAITCGRCDLTSVIAMAVAWARYTTKLATCCDRAPCTTQCKLATSPLADVASNTDPTSTKGCRDTHSPLIPHSKMKLWLCCGIFLELHNPFSKRKKTPDVANRQLFQQTHTDIDPRTGRAKEQKQQTPEVQH
jgi:hypothetical protein